MAERHWTVRVAATEADLAIAIDANPGDIITCDSDMLAYESIVTLWRPVSNGMTLNIHYLDPTEVVHGYLANSRVVSKNKDNKEFEDSIRVFIDKRQTKLDSVDSTSDAQILYGQLRLNFKDLCTRHNELKRVRTQRATSDEIVRLRAPRSWNRYRTVSVESPRQISKASGTPSQHQPGIAQEPTSTSSDLENQGHPALPRTRTSLHSQQYSFKRHQEKVSHEPPAWAKQLTWKALKEMSDSNNDPSTTDTTDSKGKRKSDQAPSATGLRASKETNKQSLKRRVQNGSSNVSMQLHWSAGPDIFTATGAAITNTTGLSDANRRLLLQRGATDGTSPPIDAEKEEGEKEED
ncbi:hypothetical protein KI688_007952 [Linnemannia hyalina]|uniref:Uncharacterized protein n=1 Tax=Linnemannia hyalina TaxID=64524 RepID=A0A9P7XIS8_9FUNG|nr:hypothetical protein KI688_007952 [Linnemannia hyalina]